MNRNGCINKTLLKYGGLIPNLVSVLGNHLRTLMLDVLDVVMLMVEQYGCFALHESIKLPEGIVRDGDRVCMRFKLGLQVTAFDLLQGTQHVGHISQMGFLWECFVPNVGIISSTE